MKTIGIMGAGQLGMMLGAAAGKLGLECVFLDPSQSPPAASVGRVIAAEFDNAAALASLAEMSDVVTYEFENVPVMAARSVESTCQVFPPPRALEFAQDRFAEKQLFASLRIPVPGYHTIDAVADLKRAIDSLGLPLVVKTRRMGYDGKGQAVLRSAGDASNVFDALGGEDLIAEEFVRFDREVSAIGVRSISGNLATYALSENEHRDGILRLSRATVEDEQLRTIADGYLKRLLENLQYVGVLALELFVVGDRLLANEFAPRVHNSGHWTIEGANSSQFENHVRAITGMPLADTSVIGFPGMANIISAMPENLSVFEAEEAILHDYDKAARPGRKLGHVTVVGDSVEDRDRRLKQLQDALPG